jgi:hypothetical protein
MLPLIPKSVKMEPEISSRLKAVSNLLGYSENQFIVEAVKATLDGAEDESNSIPRVFVLIRSAKNHDKSPSHFGHVPPPSSSKKGTSCWWGT